MPIECNREIIKIVKVMLSHTHATDFGISDIMAMSIFIWISSPGYIVLYLHAEKNKHVTFKYIYHKHP